MALSDTDRDTSGRWKAPGAGESGIREVLDRTPIRYYQRVNALLDITDAEAQVTMPMRPLRGLGHRRRAGASSRVSGGVR